MPDSSEGPTPPEGVSTEIVDALSGASVHELRLAIIYAQERLQRAGADRSPIEARPGEDILRVTEREGYTEVVKRVPCGEDCADCPHGPYLYHVTQEPHPGDRDHVHWNFIGRVVSDEN
jgi:hypothetical protein